jgi:hypothetical protein
MRITSSGFSYGRKPKIKLTPAARRQMAAQGITPEQLAANNAAHHAQEQAGTLAPDLAANNRRHHAAERAGTLRPKWSAPKMNNVAGNSRQGSSYRTGYDDAGNELHLYVAEAGGIPREVVRVGSRKKATMARYDNTPRSAVSPRPPARKRRKSGDQWIG